MKIGVTCYPTYGGSGIVATELGMELAARGHEIHFITYANPIRLSGSPERITYHEVEVSSYPLFQYPPYCLALASRMYEVAQEAGLDLLHVHYAVPHSVSAWLASQMAPRRLPFVTTLHGTDVTLVGNDPSYLPITRFSIERSPGVTVISEYLRRRTVEVFGVTNDIEVIPNFVNCEVYRPRAAPELRARFAEPGEKILIHLSNFRPVKRVQDCVRILASVVRHVPAKLLMAGEGPERPAAERLARELGVAGKTVFLGERLNVPELLPLADFMLAPSEMEGFGLAALEAMACAVPAIASRVGGLPEVIQHGVDGMLLPVGDTEAMAAAAVEILSAPEKHREMAAAARRSAETRFSSDRIVPLYEAHYERVLGKT